MPVKGILLSQLRGGGQYRGPSQPLRNHAHPLEGLDHNPSILLSQNEHSWVGLLNGQFELVAVGEFSLLSRL